MAGKHSLIEMHPSWHSETIVDFDVVYSSQAPAFMHSLGIDVTAVLTCGGKDCVLCEIDLLLEQGLLTIHNLLSILQGDELFL